MLLFHLDPVSLSGVQQLLQTEEQREDLETSEEKLTDEFGMKQSYQVQVVQEGSDVIEKELPGYEIVRPLNEEALDISGERIQRVVITKEWTQTQDDGEKRIERVERRVIKLGSGDTFERLEIMEQRLEEVEAIGRKLVEVEELRVGLQEVESLEQRLQQAEKEGLQLMKKDDWYIFLDRRPLTVIDTPRGMSCEVHFNVTGVLHPKMKMHSSFGQPQVVPKLNEFLLLKM